jgi:hypothetical protein
MVKKGIENQLLELEHQYWRALQEHDVQTAVALTDFPCLITGPSGMGQIDEATFASLMHDAPYEIRNVELDDDAKVRLISNDVAILAYKVKEELMVDGEPVAFEAWDSSTWVRRNGHWLCALHSEAIAGDAYGRDKRDEPS